MPKFQLNSDGTGAKSRLEEAAEVHSYHDSLEL